MHDDINSLTDLIKEFLASSALAYKKLEACADIMRLITKSYNKDLNRIAEELDSEVEVFTRQFISKLQDKLNIEEPKSNYPTGLIEHSSLNYLQTIIAMANELDKTGDPELIKEASVLDEILLTLAAPRDAKEVFKLAEEKEIERLREKYKQESTDRAYKFPKEEFDKGLKVADTIKAIDNSIKEYRPLETALSTRTCPDHPGAQMLRITDSIFQCSLDKKIYNYLSGFTTMKGNKVPGGDVSNQTQSLGDRAIEHSSFDSRESKLNG